MLATIAFMHNTIINRIAMVLHFKRRRLMQLIELALLEGEPSMGLQQELELTVKVGAAFSSARAANEEGRTRLVELPRILLEQAA